MSYLYVFLLCTNNGYNNSTQNEKFVFSQNLMVFVKKTILKFDFFFREVGVNNKRFSCLLMYYTRVKFCGTIKMEMWIQGGKKRHARIPTILKELVHEYVKTW